MCRAVKVRRRRGGWLLPLLLLLLLLVLLFLLLAAAAGCWWRVRSRWPALHAALRRPAAGGADGGPAARVSSRASGMQLPTRPSASTTARKEEEGGTLLPAACGLRAAGAPAAVAGAAAAGWGEPEGCSTCRLCARLGSGMRCVRSERVVRPGAALGCCCCFRLLLLLLLHEADGQLTRKPPAAACCCCCCSCSAAPAPEPQQLASSPPTAAHSTPAALSSTAGAWKPRPPPPRASDSTRDCECVRAWASPGVALPPGRQCMGARPAAPPLQLQQHHHHRTFWGRCRSYRATPSCCRVRTPKRGLLEKEAEHSPPGWLHSSAGGSLLSARWESIGGGAGGMDRCVRVRERSEIICD